MKIITFTKDNKIKQIKFDNEKIDKQLKTMGKQFKVAFEKPKIMDDLKIKMPDTVEEETSEIHRLLYENTMTMVAKHRDWQVKMKQIADQHYLKKYMYLGEEHTFIALIEKTKDFDTMAYAVLATSSTDRIEVPLTDVLGWESWKNMRK